MVSGHDYIWKVIVAGDGGVGKTTIIHRYISNEFVDTLKITIGCDFHERIIDRQGKSIQLVLWDLSGQDRFRFFQGEYIRGASGCFLCFDTTRHSTLESCREWIDLIHENAPGVPILLVGTKFDLITDETVYHDEVTAVRTFVDEFGLLGCSFTSSKTGMNVDETIAFLVDVLLYQAYLSESANGAII